MYNVSNDARCIKSCMLIRNALFELLEENGYNLEAMEVSDISARSRVSRATFYRHFDAPIDVLYWVSNVKVEDTSDSALLLTKDYQSFCRRFFEYWSQNSEFLELLVNTGHPDIFLHSLERSLTRAQDRIFRGSRVSVTRQAYAISIWGGIVWSILKCWVLRGKLEDTEELIDIAMHNLPKPR